MQPSRFIGAFPKSKYISDFVAAKQPAIDDAAIDTQLARKQRDGDNFKERLEIYQLFHPSPLHKLLDF